MPGERPQPVRLARGVPGQRPQGCSRQLRVGPQPPGDLHSVDLGHHQVGEHQVDRVGGGLREGLVRLCGLLFEIVEDRVVEHLPPRAALGAFRGLWERGVASSVDLLGEATVTQTEADRYAARCAEALEVLAPATAKWPARPRLETDDYIMSAGSARPLEDASRRSADTLSDASNLMVEALASAGAKRPAGRLAEVSEIAAAIDVLAKRGLRSGRSICRRSMWNICAGVDGTHTCMLFSAHSCRKRSRRALECSGP